jgi:nickel-dependent lactate racemase
MEIPVEIQSFLMIVVLAAIGIAVPFVVQLARAYTEKAKAEIKATLGQANYTILQQAASFAVAAAEQSGLTGLIASTGKAKKQFAMETAQAWLESVGFGHIDLDRIDDAIEAKVHDMNAWEKLPAIEVPAGAVDTASVAKIRAADVPAAP